MWKTESVQRDVPGVDHAANGAYQHWAAGHDRALRVPPRSVRDEIDSPAISRPHLGRIRRRRKGTRRPGWPGSASAGVRRPLEPPRVDSLAHDDLCPRTRRALGSSSTS